MASLQSTTLINLLFLIGLITNPMHVSVKSFSLKPRIVGGTNAHEHQYHYTVGIFVDLDFICSGAIISERHLLTSAIEVEDYVGEPEKLKVIFGSPSFNKENNKKFFKVISIAKVILHPDFNEPHFINDIAILQTVKKIQFNDAIQTIPLPTDDLTTENGIEAVVTGYGSVHVRNHHLTFNSFEYLSIFFFYFPETQRSQPQLLLK